MLLIPRTKPCLGIDRHQVRSGRFRIIKREIIQELLYPDGRWIDSPAVLTYFLIMVYDAPSASMENVETF